MRNKTFMFLVFGLLQLLPMSLIGEARFPKPEFDSQYKLPELMFPEQVISHSNLLLVIILFLALSLTTFFIYKKRSRAGVVTILIFSLIYFGFIQKGCVCVVGSIQNITLAIFDHTYAIPFAFVIFFMLPLFFALFFGRVFCSSVCPLGAIQDILILKPLKIPRWLEHILGLIPYIYLGLAILFAATGAGFIICEYDPYIAFFRLYGSYNMIIYGIIFLLVGAFVGRAYCRFLCPYGVLLRWCSFFAKYSLSITPGECIQCRLCEDACPFGAINKPTDNKIPESRKKGKERLAFYLVALPIVMFLFGYLVSKLDVFLSQQHSIVALAEQVRSEALDATIEPTWSSASFSRSQKSNKELYKEALIIREQFRIGGWIMGAFLGLVVMGKMILLSIRKESKNYEVDRMKCFTCGRCYKACPVEPVDSVKKK